MTDCRKESFDLLCGDLLVLKLYEATRCYVQFFFSAYSKPKGKLSYGAFKTGARGVLKSCLALCFSLLLLLQKVVA